MTTARASLVRRVVLGATLVALMPVSAVQAADVVPIVTLDPIKASVYRGDTDAFVAHVSGGTPVAVNFETSTDGVTWESYGPANHSLEDPSLWYTSSRVPGSTPLGQRYVRAASAASFGVAAAYSDPQTQQILIHQAEVVTFNLLPGLGQTVLPGTDPVTIGATFTGTVPRFDRLVGSTWQPLETLSSGTEAWATTSALGEGDTTFRAIIPDTDFFAGTSRELTVTIAKGATSPAWYGDLVVQAHHSVPVGLGVNAPFGGVPIVGTISATDVASGTVLVSGDVSNAVAFTLPAMSVGQHSFRVDYAGTTNFAPSTATFVVTVVADVVEAAGIGLDATSFYPVTDGYRDVVRARGTRLERASVRVVVYNSLGRAVRTLSAPLAAGAYSIPWNGRNASGVLQPAGRYRVVQTLTDAAGTQRSVAAFVTTSLKRLYTYTKYVDVVTPAAKTSAWAGWQFRVPSATVYKSLTFQIYGRSIKVAGISMGGWDIRACAYTQPWSPTCVLAWKSVPYTTGWWGIGLSTTYDRKGLYVRGLVSTEAGSGVVYKTRLRVVYGLLK